LRSSRHREQATHRNVEWLWLLKQLRAAHKTLAAFRTPTLWPLRQVCRTVPLLCTKLDLCGAERVASDGSPCSAGSAQERTFTTDTRTKLIRPLDERVEA
jgi:transposase